ncbi:MAG: tRNA uridine-5-carboxymethylaminomethyl(34) synthesis GTPase MnmE [Chloroflexi bacterium RBG_13_52_14]|nr:MAG: tRNA uridine-5-carboxymethylaminomethyl(34) synthesis GTPase MnmE [Chloroflexi bacterium RBG_13_52_14]
MYQDTIAAISTPIGEGGIGIVRLSGREALPIVQRLFSRKLENRRLVYGHIVDPDSRELVDEVLAAYMKAPHTYTREDIVEIDCHGGPIPLQRILGLALRNGARLANPGEFTLRAFLNGRIDLAQAESVLDVIQSKTQASLRLAMQGLDGKLSEPVREVRRSLMDILAYLTARIDFPEDEVAEQDIKKPLEKARSALQQLVANADAGMVYRLGVRTAIVGRPNVGKSSLLNRLLRQSRAIVTPIPGTTRDTLEETVNLKGVPFLLIDTAGIMESNNVVEALAVERSRKAITQADFVLLVIDSSEPLTQSDRGLIDLLSEKTVLVAANKCDLPRRADLDELPWLQVSTSALTGEGLEGLETAMVNSVLGGKVVTSDALLVTNPRHKEALQRAERHLRLARAALEENLPDDFVTIDLTAALNALGEITGEAVTDELLDIIFSRFCIGK